MIWRLRPNRTVAKNWSPAFSDEGPGSRLRLEWLADGCTVKCFWTGPRRLIAALESQLRFGLTTELWLARLSPYRCLAGRLASETIN
jgi:hypothetical protein